MLASWARRGGPRLLAGLPRAEAAAALLDDLSQSSLPECTAAAGASWSPSFNYGGTAAAVGGGQPAAWACLLGSSSPYSSTAASLLAARRPEEQPGSATTVADAAEPHHVGSGTSGGSPAAGSEAAPSSAPAAAPPAGRQPIVTGTWLDRLPQSWVPYAQLMRLEKPIGTWLLAWPCLWSICLAAPPGTSPDLRLMALFGLGAVLLRGAGCTINDLWDRELDRRVERTRGRPLAAGAVTPAQAVGGCPAARRCSLPRRGPLCLAAFTCFPVTPAAHPNPLHPCLRPVQPSWRPNCRRGWPSWCSSTRTASCWAPPRWPWWLPTHS